MQKGLRAVQVMDPSVCSLSIVHDHAPRITPTPCVCRQRIMISRYVHTNTYLDALAVLSSSLDVFPPLRPGIIAHINAGEAFSPARFWWIVTPTAQGLRYLCSIICIRTGSRCVGTCTCVYTLRPADIFGLCVRSVGLPVTSIMNEPWLLG